MPEITVKVIKSSATSKCQRCGGQLLRSYDEVTCFQCGAPHTQEGNLVAKITPGWVLDLLD